MTAAATMPVTVVVQMRSHRAGAQVALSRLFSSAEFRELNPLVVMRNEGWLSEKCRENGIEYLATPFPKSRAWHGRLWGVRSFVKALLKEISKRGAAVQLAVANDYTEGLIVHEIARRTKVPTASFVRTVEATDYDLKKYRCASVRRMFPIGSDLGGRIEKLFPGLPIHRLDEGLEPADFRPAKPKASQFPGKILVVGSEDPLKGWADMTAAIDLLERDPNFPTLEFDFTGLVPDPARNDVRAGMPRRAKLNFIGRQNNFTDFVRTYDLVLHPAQRESFGLAMFEIIAAGVPMLCSRAGEIQRAGKSADWLHTPGDVQDLAARLRYLRENWPDIKPDVENAQQVIKKNFMADAIARATVTDLKALIAGRRR